MSNEVKIFENAEFGSVRIVTENGEPWFVGKDVTEILGYSNSRDALSKRVDDEDKIDGVAICDSIGRQQKPVLINESGLYSLILSSKLPKAKEFKRWVTSEVLPQIRKTGGYIPVQETDDDLTILSKAILIADKTMKEKDAIIAKQTEALSIAEPKVEFYDRLMNSVRYSLSDVCR